MNLIDIPTEQTTAVTDLFLSLVALVVSMIVYHTGKARDRKKARIWSWAFGLLAVASVFGAAAHGLEITDRMRYILWQPINFCLGLTVALFAAGVVYDLKRSTLPRPVLPVFIGASMVFYLITLLVPGIFFVFILYEAVALLFALFIYIFLAYKEKNTGYFLMACGILISIIAAVIQAANSVHLTFIWEFDHNGIFHIVQMIGLVILLAGLQKGFKDLQKNNN